MFIDGSANIKGTRLGLVLKSPQGDMIVQSIRCEFKATNNEAEYETLIVGLTVAKDMNIKKINVKSDSLLIVSQINGTYAAKDSKMTAYLDVVKKLVKEFDKCKIEQVPRDQNSQADALANLGSAINPTKLQNIPIITL